ncbi:DNAH5 [Cordylochernes scorpioides]|uniref:DNAH5 n=1 Tax=Cordylochernes scorpioides TaxID=51811 RepID=A0ABY6L596_9ARAC|nr:DNAH5 [Cordylochernes scorpioides]
MPYTVPETNRAIRDSPNDPKMIFQYRTSLQFRGRCEQSRAPSQPTQAKTSQPSSPFETKEYRTILMEKWQTELREREISFTADLDLVDMMVDAPTVGEWNLYGLPSDELSTQNGLIVTKASCYPLLIDPQGQGKQWIRNLEARNELQVNTIYSETLMDKT